MRRGSHAHGPDPSNCPSWCLDQGAPDHPDQHTGYPVSVDGELPDASPVEFFAESVMPVDASRPPRVALGRRDETHVLLSPPAARSLAAALTRTADVLEGLAMVEGPRTEEPTI